MLSKDSANSITIDLDSIFISGPLQTFSEMALDLTASINDPRLKPLIWKNDTLLEMNFHGSSHGTTLAHTLQIPPDNIRAASFNILI